MNVTLPSSRLNLHFAAAIRGCRSENMNKSRQLHSFFKHLIKLCILPTPTVWLLGNLQSHVPEWASHNYHPIRSDSSCAAFARILDPGTEFLSGRMPVFCFCHYLDIVTIVILHHSKCASFIFEVQPGLGCLGYVSWHYMLSPVTLPFLVLLFLLSHVFMIWVFVRLHWLTVLLLFLFDI